MLKVTDVERLKEFDLIKAGEVEKVWNSGK